ncbi:MAG: HAMP domain-containing sensor histidine kinase [Eubacteriales bacterium]|nr:HAMP domain-containing sensor histidine kinase [Eubacteriales bacterium]
MRAKRTREPVSVQRKLSTMMLFLVFFSIGLTALINWVFQDKYYLFKTREMFEDSHEKLRAVANEPNSSILQKRSEYDYLIGNIARNQNCSIIINYEDPFGSGFSLTAGAENQQYMNFKLRNYLSGVALPERTIERMYGDAVLQVSRENISYDHYKNLYELWGRLDDDTTFMIMVTIDDIEKTVQTSTQFILILGALFGIISAGIAIYFSDRFARPIRRLNKVTREMAEMNFDVRYEEDSYREINELGYSVNHMSEKMKEFISELKQKNVKLKRTLHKREEMDDMRKEFISNVSHELKTPIALIMGYAEGLKMGINDTSPEERNQYCDVITDEANRMNKMVQNLLMLTELEFGENEMQPERFDIVDFVTNIAESFRIVAQKKDVTIRILHEGDPIMIWSDPWKLETVFRNFISNALNHVDEHKKVEINFKMKPKEQRVRVGVFNSGEPIPREIKDRIWEKFYKADKARTRDYGGNGIGLSIVKAILEIRKLPYGCINRSNGVEFYVELETK